MGDRPTPGGGRGRLLAIARWAIHGPARRVPVDRPLAAHCLGGARSAIAASVLKANGIDNVINLAGGISAWQNAGHTVVQERHRGLSGSAPAREKRHRRVMRRVPEVGTRRWFALDGRIGRPGIGRAARARTATTRRAARSA